MYTFEGIDENFKFIVMDVDAQARTARAFIEAPEAGLYRKIASRDDYIDNLKTIIENKCFARINGDKTLDPAQLNKIRAIQVICVNLERIADFLVNIVRQMGFLEDQSFIHRYAWQDSFDVIQESLGHILDAFRKENMSKALSICKAENNLDRLYKESFDRIMLELKSGQDIQNLVTVLFIFRYFERIGDSILNIGEAIIFAIIGERIKIEQFEALQRTLSKSGFSESVAEIDFKAIWGSRSGCRIGRVGLHEGGAGRAPDRQSSIYKEGSLEKIRQEKVNIERWKSLFPGLVADVFGFHEDEEEGKGAMLVEFLQGCTLDEVVLTSEEEFMRNALFVLEQTVRDAWTATLQPGAFETGYMAQLRKRLDGVLRMHPEFWRLPQAMGTAVSRSTEDLLAECELLEKEIPAPFTVFVHGDFNINNIVYNHETQQVHYIDLYRSKDYDYLQDAATFLVSNFRMPIFEPALRERIELSISIFHDFVKSFAAEREDATYEARLALALSRAFYTSTRFELNHRFAKEMFMRSTYLMEKIAGHNGSGPWESFRLPENILYL